MRLQLMKKWHQRLRVSRFFTRYSVGLLALGISYQAVALEPITDAQPAAPQPAAEQLSPGLGVMYSYGYFGHVNKIEKLKKPFVGKPLENINHRTIDGNVLTAGRPMGVAAHIRGFIRFDETGTYKFRLESNDGVKFSIAGKRLWFDPEIHGNRWSPPIEFVVNETGWYDFAINYYQKKGTSALRLRWTPPNGEEVPVPPEAFAHIPG